MFVDLSNQYMVSGEGMSKERWNIILLLLARS